MPQILEHIAQPARRGHRLVADHLRRKLNHIELRIVGKRTLCAPARTEQRTLERASSIAAAALTKIWRTRGHAAAASGPQASGIDRHIAPTGHAQTFFEQMALPTPPRLVVGIGRETPIRRQNVRPVQYRPRPPTRATRIAGRWISTPQPSPLTPSAFTPPRWESLASAANAVSTTHLLARPSIWATRPKPQLSCSKPGRTNVVLDRHDPNPASVLRTRWAQSACRAGRHVS